MDFLWGKRFLQNRTNPYVRPPNGGSFEETEYNIDAVVFSKDDLTLNGETYTITVGDQSGTFEAS